MANQSSSPYWLESIKHQGRSPFNSNKDYTVFRNVRDFGAVGNGVADDTKAINLAITSGGRCGPLTNCKSSTITPALVYFPSGTYRVTSPIVPYYYTQLIGDAKKPPTLLADISFEGIAVIDVNPYIPGGGGEQVFTNQNTFFRAIRNFVIDVREVAFDRSQGTGIHWQVAQATSLTNVRFEMSKQPGTAHQGIWMENGSGGLMNDLVFNGGKFGMWVGNQQFTVRNITINDAETGVFAIWNWGWTFQNITINNCKRTAFNITTGEGCTSGEAIMDATVSNTPVFLIRSTSSNGQLHGSIVLHNIVLENVPIAVTVENGQVLLPGTTSSTIIPSWAQGNVYKGTSEEFTFTEGSLSLRSPIPSVLLNEDGKIACKSRPQYADFSVSQIISVKDYGAIGDGVADDTVILQNILYKYSSSHIIFFDAGTYLVTFTLFIPANTRIIGEAWSTIAGAGSAFQDMDNPQVVVKVGHEGDTGCTEITDMIFSTIGPAPGAIVVEWNVRDKDGEQVGGGMWDTHIRLGGVAGSKQQVQNCPKDGSTDNPSSFVAYLALHLTTHSTAYLEGTWVWLADHDLDTPGDPQITLYAGRGILSESQGPVWMVGTAVEHFVLYQYNLANAKDHYMGLIQTETPYFQPLPPPPTPFFIDPKFHDPEYPIGSTATSWALRIKNSQSIIIFGAGLYSFFENYSQVCIDNRDCQSHIVDVGIDSSDIRIFSLATVASTWQISVDCKGIVNEYKNWNGFVSTVTFWSL